MAAILGLIQENANERTEPTRRTLRRVTVLLIEGLRRAMSLHLMSVLISGNGTIDVYTIVVSRRTRGIDGTGVTMTGQ